MRAGIWMPVAFFLLTAFWTGISQAEVQCTPDAIEQMQSLGMNEAQIGEFCPDIDLLSAPQAPGTSREESGSGILERTLDEEKPLSGFTGAPYEGVWRMEWRRISCDTTEPPITRFGSGEGDCVGLKALSTTGQSVWHIRREGDGVVIANGDSYSLCTAGSPLEFDEMSFDSITLETKTEEVSGFNRTTVVHHLTYDPSKDLWSGTIYTWREFKNYEHPTTPYKSRYLDEAILTREDCS